MKYIIYGSRGWIGKYISGILTKAGDTVFSGSRVGSFTEIQKEIENLNPDRIISCLGRTSGNGFNSIDYLEDKLEENVNDNLYAPLVLAQISREYSIPMLYIGTGCIFEYDVNHTIDNGIGFTEKDTPNFFGSAYSIVKGKLDSLMKGYPTVLNARIRMPISNQHHQRDFITKIMNYPQIVSIQNSMTILEDIIPTLIGLISMGITGTINATNPGTVSHKEILDIFDHHDYKLMTIDDQNKILKSKRSNNYLDTTLIENLHHSIPEDIKEKYQISMVLKSISERIIDICNLRKGTDHKIIFSTPTKRILITGGCGFIASNFINHHLQEHPNDFILNIDRLDKCSNTKNIVVKSDKYKFVKSDINNKEILLFLLEEYSIDHVIHFAAQTHVDHSFGNSIEFTLSNVLGTHTLIEACRFYGKIKKFIHVSTDEVYGEIASGSNSEDSVLNPTNPYAATKSGAEFIVKSYGKSFGFPYIITRGNNVFGKYQYPDKVIPKFIQQLSNGKKLTIHGDGSSIRNFIHVDNVVNAFEIILDKGVINEIYNIGSNDEISVIDLAKEIIKIMKQDDHDKYIEYIPDRNFNDCRYSIETYKLMDLGWKQEKEFYCSLKETIEWYLSNQNHWGNN